MWNDPKMCLKISQVMEMFSEQVLLTFRGVLLDKIKSPEFPECQKTPSLTEKILKINRHFENLWQMSIWNVFPDYSLKWMSGQQLTPPCCWSISDTKLWMEATVQTTAAVRLHDTTILISQFMMWVKAERLKLNHISVFLLNLRTKTFHSFASCSNQRHVIINHPVMNVWILHSIIWQRNKPKQVDM